MDGGLDLLHFLVPSPISEVFYIPEFITVEEEKYLTRKVIPFSTIVMSALVATSMTRLLDHGFKQREVEDITRSKVCCLSICLPARGQ